MHAAKAGRLNWKPAPSFFRAHRHAARLLAIGCLFLVTGVETPAVTVSVSEFGFQTVPDSLLDGEFVILNDENVPVSIDIETVDWDRTQEGLTQFYEPGLLERSCASWIAVSPSKAILAPGAEIEPRIEIHVPEFVQGTYWAGWLIHASGILGSSPSGDLQWVRQFLIRVFVTVLPTSMDARVARIDVRGLHPLGIDLDFSNTGDTLLSDVSGLVAIESSTGVLLMEVPLMPFQLLPGYTVHQVVNSGMSLDVAGLYLVRTVIDFGGAYLVAGQTVLRIDELSPSVIGTAEASFSDLNGDGLYEDVDGDGALTAADAALLKAYIDSSAVQRNARAFDFDNDGRATIADADALVDLVLRIAD